MKRRNIAGLLMLLILFLSCGRKEEKAEILMEHGVEVVLNRFEPYRVKGDPLLRLEEEFIIDLLDPYISQAGLYGLDQFAVNDAGEIFLLQESAEADHIYKFSQDGRFLFSFARDGQGPGEIRDPTCITITPDEKIQVSYYWTPKLTFYNGDGSLAREVALQANFPVVQPLENGLSVVVGRSRPGQDKPVLRYPIELRDQNFQLLKLLDEIEIENSALTGRIRGIPPGHGMAFGGKHIFIANEARDYEIWVFDQEGQLVRKIRKQFHPLPVTNEIKEKFLADANEDFRPLLYFPESLPPCRALFSDEDGRLFVMTYEPAEVAGESIIDVFDRDGIFTGRLSADIFLGENTVWGAIVRAGRVYYIREKADGYKQLVVERILQE